MKKLFISLLLCLVSAGGAIAVEGPVIFYSDLISGPNTGGADDKGAWVTVNGRRFGAEQGGGYVTVGGGQADNYVVWCDSVIVFQLGQNAATGNIVVQTSSGTSNGVPFTVRVGNIYFIEPSSGSDTNPGSFASPWRSPAKYLNMQVPGDICYLREGMYQGCYGSASQRWCEVGYYNMNRRGTLDAPIAWVGYPRETAFFNANEPDGVLRGCFDLTTSSCVVLANLKCYGYGDNYWVIGLRGPNCRVVNCDISGLRTLGYGQVYCNGKPHQKILGNDFHGILSQDKRDHCIYLCDSGVDDVEIGWNNFHDNQCDIGPLISLNNEVGGNYTNITVHDNVINCNGTIGCRAFYCAGSGDGNTGSIYNNLIIRGGGRYTGDGTLVFGRGTWSVCNNTFFRSRVSAAGQSVYAIRQSTGTLDIRDNIFYLDSDTYYVYIGGTATIRNNCYYGGRGSAPAADAGRVQADPLFVNADETNYDLHLSSSSPCISTGADTTAICPKDLDGNSKVDIGAYEFKK